MTLQIAAVLQKKKPIVEREVEKVLREREEHSLAIPSRHTVEVGLYAAPDGIACADMQKSSLEFFLIPYLEGTTEGKVKRSAGRLVDFLATLDRVVEINEDEDVLTLLQDPSAGVKAIKAAQFDLSLQDHLIFSEFEEQRHRLRQEMLARTIAKAKDDLDIVTQKIKQINNVQKLPTAHEADHLAFDASPWQTRVLEEDLALVDLGEQYAVTQKLDDLSRYATARIAHLSAQAQWTAIVEGRALYLDYLPRGSWNKVNWSRVSMAALQDLVATYGRAFLYEVAEAYAALALSRGEMPKEDLQFLYNRFTGTVKEGAEFLMTSTEQMRYPVARDILGEKVAYWSRVFVENAHVAMDAIGHAYQHRPEALRESNTARSFDEFIALSKAGA